MKHTDNINEFNALADYSVRVYAPALITDQSMLTREGAEAFARAACATYGVTSLADVFVNGRRFMRITGERTDGSSSFASTMDGAEIFV